MLKVIGASYCNAQDEKVILLNQRPELRRATEAMRLALVACEEALDSAKILPNDKQKMLILVGSSYGELEVTKDFLHEWYSSQLARPILFQNSLHNAILGFLSIQLKLKGPGMTLSNGARTPTDLIEVANVFLQNGEIDMCLVCQVDSYMQKLREQVQFKGEASEIKEGASALILIRKNQFDHDSEMIIPLESHFQPWADGP